jgi:hypothetical protein
MKIAQAWREAQVNLEADIDPEALTVMAAVEADFAAIDDNLARAPALPSRTSSGLWRAHSP